jgi:type I restriction enzyme S subunit
MTTAAQQRMDSAHAVSLGELAHIEMGQAPASSSVSDEGVGLPFLQGNAEFGALTPHHTLYCSHPAKTCDAGDILISVRAPVGAVNKADRQYCIGRGLAAIQFRRARADFGLYLVTYWARDLYRVSQGTTFEAVGREELENLSVVTFSEVDQKRIGQILDTVSREIQDTEFLIAKLVRIKHGFMQDLLTRGIDEHGNIRSEKTHKFKDSPLGRVPEEWDVAPMPSLLEVIDNRGRTPPFVEAGIPYVGADNIKNGRIDQASITRFVTAATFRKYMRGVPTGGDILFTTEAPLGEVAIVPEGYSFCFAQRVIALEALAGRDNRFFGYVLRADSVRRQFKSLASGSTVEGISARNMKRVLLPFPKNRDEQSRIVAAISSADRHIEGETVYEDKLQSLKRGLMADLLTGKVRVNHSIKH